MRLLSKRQLKELVLYSPQHIQRLENANRFPKRVRLGNGPRSRVGWIESEVMEWLRNGLTHAINPPTPPRDRRRAGSRPGASPISDDQIN